MAFKRLKSCCFITLILKSNKKRLLLYELIWIDPEKVFNEIIELLKDCANNDKNNNKESNEEENEKNEEKEERSYLNLLKEKKVLLLGFEPFLALKLANLFKELDIVDEDINLIEATKEFLPEIWQKDNVAIYYEDYFDFLQKTKEKYDLIIFIVKPRTKIIFFSRKFLLLMKEKADKVIINNDKPPLKKTEDFKTEKLIKKLEELKDKGKIKEFKVLNNTICYF